MHEQLNERLWCVKGRKVSVDCVMILMTAIIGRLFDKHHRFVYCLTWKLWGAYSPWGFTSPPPNQLLQRGLRPKQMCHSVLASFFFRAFLPKWNTFVVSANFDGTIFGDTKAIFSHRPYVLILKKKKKNKKTKGQGILVIHQLFPASVLVSSVLYFHRQPLRRRPTLLPPSRV